MADITGANPGHIRYRPVLIAGSDHLLVIDISIPTLA